MLKQTMNVLMSSSSNEWGTPKWLFNILDNKLHFDLDACASYENHLVDEMFTKDNSCLDYSWDHFHSVFMNPPYGRQLKDFVKKGYEESLKGIRVVMLIPARTDTKYFHDYILDKCQIIFVRGRLKFGVKGVTKGSAPFPSMICIYNAWSGEYYDFVKLQNEINKEDSHNA